MTAAPHIYEVRPRKDKRGVDLISDVLPCGRRWYGEPDDARSRKRYERKTKSRHAVKRDGSL